MNPHASKRMLRVFLYGGGSALLLLDVILLLKSTFTGNYIPMVPVIAGIFTAAGLLFIVYAEQKAREEDKKNHRRIARVANQLTSPLQHLQDDLTRLLKDAGKLPSKQRLQIKRMDTKANILLENVRDVFLAMQAQEGRISQEVRTYNICALLQEAHDRAQLMASASNVELVYQAHCEQAPVKVDRRLFLIALQHLIANGIQYTLKPGLVNLAIMKSDKYTRIVIQDRGLGVAPEDKYSIFEPFARGEDASKYDPDGIGIGLALSRLIIKEFNGTLTWRPKPHGTGSEFTIRLPLVNK